MGRPKKKSISINLKIEEKLNEELTAIVQRSSNYHNRQDFIKAALEQALKKGKPVKILDAQEEAQILAYYRYFCTHQKQSEPNCQAIEQLFKNRGNRMKGRTL